MRIGLDIAPLRPPYTGVSNYEIWLLEALLAMEDAPEFRGFAYGGWRSVDRDFVTGCLVEADKTGGAPSAAAAPAPRRDRARLLALALRGLRASPAVHAAASDLRGRVFAGTVGRQGIDLFHAFVYRAPSLRPRMPVIPVVWDLSHVRHPEAHPPARLRWMRHVADTCRTARAIHTISEFTAHEIVELFGVDRARIHVIPPAASPVFQNDPRDVLLPPRLGLSPRGYALTVSTLEPRKNLRTLLTAYAALEPDQRGRMPLVVAGAKGWGDLGLDRVLERLVGEGSLRLAGYVTDAELAGLYRHARAMFYPSLYEGFGMPVIEALATGTPVVASDAASMPEALGGAGRLVSPLDVDGWTVELRRALEDVEMFSPEAVARRRARAAAWSWTDAAARTLAMYRAVSGVSGGG